MSKKCVQCGKPCEHVGDKNKEGFEKVYCCLCLPFPYIRKPIKDWLCMTCTIRHLIFRHMENS